jgi:hypothetical protein
MHKRYVLGAFAVTVLATAGIVLADGPKSGPQVGDKILVPFHPLNVTGAMAGKKHCLV